MSRRIVLSEEEKRALYDEMFENFLSPTKFLSSDTISISHTLQQLNDKAVLNITPLAYSKMMSLIQYFNSEVAWHGLVERGQDAINQNVFTITDVLVYPQEVTGTTVTTDQEAYEQWLMELPDEVFNKVRMQGHSHVDMSVFSSSVDQTHQLKIAEQLGKDDYYIFMIWNKRHQYSVKIFDMVTNTYFENDDVVVCLDGDVYDGDAFLSEAKDLVKTKTYSYSNYASSSAKKDATPITSNHKSGKKSNKYYAPKNSSNYTVDDYPWFKGGKE